MVLNCKSAFIALAAQNLESLVQFYSQLIGQPPMPHIPTVYAEFRLPGLRLGIFRPQSTHASEFENSAYGTLSLCLEVTHLEGAIAHLTALGYPPPGPILNASHGREIYAYDPEGNRLILHQESVS
jgi:predicted enzyme related to lactoylglutathione lyase